MRFGSSSGFADPRGSGGNRLGSWLRAEAHRDLRDAQRPR